MSLRPVRQRRRSGAARLRARWWGFIRRGVDVGPGVRVGSGVRLFLGPGSSLVLGARCEIDDGTTIAVYRGGRLDLGTATFVGHHCTLAVRDAVTIGAGTHLAEMVSVRDHDHKVGALPSSGEMTVEPVAIGSNAWVGAKVTVLRGARIGDGAVVGANAVVRGELPARSVCVGMPARVVRFLDGEKDRAVGRLQESTGSTSPLNEDRGTG